MKEISISGRNGYPVRALSSVADSSEQILLCLRGFGGGGRSAVVDLLAERLSADGIGVFTFDWPGHGRSPAGSEELTVEHCLTDLETVLFFLRGAPFGRDLPVSCFATSFGGYLALLYRNRHPEAFRSLILRSPALRMADIIRSFVPEAEREAFRNGKRIDFGFGRELLLGREFLKDLEQWDPLREPVPHPERVMIIQGDRDDVADPLETENYAERNHISVHLVKGAGHQYKNPGETDKIISCTRNFLLKQN